MIDSLFLKLTKSLYLKTSNFVTVLNISLYNDKYLLLISNSNCECLFYPLTMFYLLSLWQVPLSLILIDHKVSVWIKQYCHIFPLTRHYFIFIPLYPIGLTVPRLSDLEPLHSYKYIFYHSFFLLFSKIYIRTYMPFSIMIFFFVLIQIKSQIYLLDELM